MSDNPSVTGVLDGVCVPGVADPEIRCCCRSERRPTRA